MPEDEVKQLRSRESAGFPVAAVKQASTALSDAIMNIRNVEGFGFGATPSIEQANALRVLADQIEQGNVLLQAVTFEQLTSNMDFVMFRWTARFAEKPSPKVQE